MNNHTCPYKDTSRDKCVHKFGKKQSSTRRKCGFKNPTNCPLFLEWLEIHTLKEEKSKIEPINPLKNTYLNINTKNNKIKYEE